MSTDRQLDLLASPSVEPTSRTWEPLAVRWVESDGAGRLGRAAWPRSPREDLAHLHGHHRAPVLLAVGDDPAELLDAARELGVDVRHLGSIDDRALLDRHAAALANDLRMGRRVVVVSRDAASTAVVIGAALLESGTPLSDVLATLGAQPDERERLEALAGEAVPESVPAPVEPPPPPDADGAPEPVTAMRAPSDAVAPATGSFEQASRSPRRSRIAGAVLGAAIGDAMGHPTEFVRSFAAIRDQFGPDGVTGFVLYRDGAALYTDDTQMAECVLRSLLDARGRSLELDGTMRDLAERFVKWASDPQGGHRAPGNACLSGCASLARGVPWHEAGGASAGGCGSVMRAYPFGLFFHDDLARAEEWAVAHSKLTHRDPIALAACAAMAVGMARTMRDEPLATVLSEMVAAACRYSASTAAMMATALDEAQRGVGPETTLQRLQGWAAHEAIAAAMYVYARHADDPRAAILEAANTPGDSDSIATLAGALCGARCGIGAFPAEWVRDVERSEELLALALAI
jgi:ADP-ribosylglycohydrolase